MYDAKCPSNQRQSYHSIKTLAFSRFLYDATSGVRKIQDPIIYCTLDYLSRNFNSSNDACVTLVATWFGEDGDRYHSYHTWKQKGSALITCFKLFQRVTRWKEWEDWVPYAMCVREGGRWLLMSSNANNYDVPRPIILGGATFALRKFSAGKIPQI